MSQVFISYSHVDPDREIAGKLRQHIEANGFEVWVDTKIGLGQNWVEQIDTQIRRSSHLIALLSPRSIQSDMVRREISIAYGLKKADKLTILPVRLALDEELPYELGAYLEHIQYICWRPGESLEPVLQAILEALQGRALAGREKTATANSNPFDSKQFARPELDAIAVQLARYLGPVARFVVDEAALKAKSKAELYAILASEIPAGEERRRFEAAMRSLR